jgi:hypothetical protein
VERKPGAQLILRDWEAFDDSSFRDSLQLVW